MRAFLATPNTLKQDEIAARQLQALNEHRRPRDKKLRLADVKRMFVQMRDQEIAERRHASIEAERRHAGRLQLEGKSID
jgi:hypothetical protein